MKRISLILLFFVFTLNIFSQETYTIDGQTYQLKTEVDGSWDLLWNVIDGQYRYFIKTDNGEINELTNTKNANGKYQEEYKDLLKTLSNGSLDTTNLKLTLSDLKTAFNKYNASQDSGYSFNEAKPKVYSRLGFFGGFTNNPFTDNPDNTFSGLLGTELELYGTQKFKRHAGFLQLTQVFENSDLKFSTTEIALGYRFRFIYTNKFNVHANVKFATLNFTKSTYSFLDDNTMELVTKEDTSTLFDAPLTLGLGADYQISNNGFITFYFNEIVSATQDNQGNFPINIAFGYKFNL